MDRSWIFGIGFILIGVIGLTFLPGSRSGPWVWSAGHMGPGMGPGMMGGPGGGIAGTPLKTRYTSNGERIYYTGTSGRTGPLRFQGGPMWLAMHGGGCVNCHGIGGRGGVPVMMGTAIPSDIRYAVLTEKEAHAHGKEGGAEEAHPPYTDALIKRAVTRGLNPAGKPLDWTMPRWEMTEEDLNDLIAYLKALH